MKKLLNNMTTRTNLVTYLLVIVAFLVMQVMSTAGLLGSSMKGFLVPICVYISLAVSLNLLVGICGELSLGHAGFMGIGAFTAVIFAALTKNVIANDFLRLLCAMICGGVLAGAIEVELQLDVGFAGGAGNLGSTHGSLLRRQGRQGRRGGHRSAPRCQW